MPSLSDYAFGSSPGVCSPWEPDTSCDPGWDEYDEATRVRATALAWSALRTLTGGRVGNCPVRLRPCLTETACGRCTGGDWLNPYVGADGHWRNAVIDGDCSCCRMCEILMPGQTAAIKSVVIDGYSLDIQLFRLDNGNRLVRQDGKCWPDCQNLSAPSGAVGTLYIDYIPGILPHEGGLAAAGILASEFAKACTSGKCRLPSNVTSIARQGVVMTFSEGYFENGTGIQDVDAYVYSVNPNRLRTPPIVMSPDSPRGKHRIETYQPIANP